jgi:hypothetical protein
MALKTLSKTISAAGTSERLSTSHVQVWAVTIRAKSTNTDDAYIGDDTVSSSDPGMEPGMSLSYDAGRGDTLLDLYDIWGDVAVSGEGFDVWYVEAT